MIGGENIMGIKINGMDNLRRKLSYPATLAKIAMDSKGGHPIKCPNCGKIIKVTSNGAKCTCGQKIELNF
ncbi:hypothetical protein [Enterococcus faecalis]|uniref:hypothetical protein n=1 Tax=Enterococcus faecalis TaxID=1351 RepID=UPI0012AEB88C|nr:hypothetical protein [Enterococcus faecalis]